MGARLATLGLPGIAARTFHAAALAQLRHFWPTRHDGAPAPAVLDSKIPIVGRLARGLPGGYRFTTAKDLADEIEWAKSRRLRPETYPAGAGDRRPPIPVELFVRLWTGYEREKDRAGRLDFDDMLTRTVDLLENDPAAAATVRARYGWFSVDEYQDTNPLQQRLLELWLGDRDDLCVVGDEDQTIYTFAGATSTFLTGFTDWFPAARQVTLDRNYRSSPAILALANRLLAAEGRRKRLVATQPSGPSTDDPSLRRRRRRAGHARGRYPAARRRRDAARRGRGPCPDQRADPADRGRPDESGHRVPGPRATLLRPAGGPRRDAHPAPTCRRRHAVARSSRPSRLDCGRSSGSTPDGSPDGAEARERTASLALVLEIAAEAVTTGARLSGAGARRAGAPGRLRGTGGGRGGGIGRRREPAHASPGERARVGRRLPARAWRRGRCRSGRRSMTTTRSPRSGGFSTSA